MKREILVTRAAWLGLFFTLVSTAAYAGGVEDWTSATPGKDVGTFSDSEGTKVDIAVVEGPSAGQKAVQVTSNLVQGGYAGVWRNLGAPADLSKAGSLKFQAKATVPGEVEIDIQDANSVSYSTTVKITSAAWSEVTVPLSAFQLNATYQPPEAVQGKPEDLSQVAKFSLGIHIVGPVVVSVGPLTANGAAGPVGSPAAQTITAGGAPLVIQDFTADDPKAGGTFADSDGSTFVYFVKDNPKKPGAKFLQINFEEKNGGYCGMFYKTGNGWDGQDWTGGKAVQFLMYSKVPVAMEFNFKDKNNNQYAATAASTQGTGWEKVQIPMGDFKLDPYYTTPDGVKGAPLDLSAVKSFNLQPKTAVKATIAVDGLEVIK